jgi:hypothetical protein
VTAVQVAIMLTVLVGFAALTIDVGRLELTKAELQNAADAAAMAGASAFADDSLRDGGYGDDPELLASLLAEEARARCIAYAASNKAMGRNVLLSENEIIVGRYDADNPSAGLDPNGIPNAVQVTARFAEGNQNGPVLNLFASVFGFHTSDVGALAAAAFDDRFTGYTQPENGPMIPFTIYVDTYEDMLVNGPDDFSYDEDQDAVQNFPDGNRELRLYPYGTWESSDGAGNFGILNVGTTNQGTDVLAEQIANGIAPADIETETSARELTFFNDDGDPTTYEITGTPGLAGGLESAVESRVGDVVGFFVHSNLVDPGSNATYTIVKVAFGRIMEVFLHGNPDNRRIVIQPVVYSDGGVHTDPDAPDSDGMVGRIILVR